MTPEHLNADKRLETHPRQQLLVHSRKQSLQVRQRYPDCDRTVGRNLQARTSARQAKNREGAGGGCACFQGEPEGGSVFSGGVEDWGAVLQSAPPRVWVAGNLVKAEIVSRGSGGRTGRGGLNVVW